MEFNSCDSAEVMWNPLAIRWKLRLDEVDEDLQAMASVEGRLPGQCLSRCKGMAVPIWLNPMSQWSVLAVWLHFCQVCQLDPCPTWNIVRPGEMKCYKRNAIVKVQRLPDQINQSYSALQGRGLPDGITTTEDPACWASVKQTNLRCALTLRSVASPPSQFKHFQQD